MVRLLSWIVGAAALASARAAPAAAGASPTPKSTSGPSDRRAVIPSLGRQPAFRRRGGGTVAESDGGSKKTIKLSTKSAVLAGCALALNAGYVNGACLSGILSSTNTKQAAAAVTGAWTNSALGAASGNKRQFAFNAKCIASYCGGSLIASLLNPYPVPFEVDPAAVSPAFLAAALLMDAASSIAKKSGGSDKSHVYPAAVACGIQNSVTSVLTGNLVRSAHFSGITSDVGTFLGQVLRGNRANLLKLKVFAALALCFWTGGYVSFSVTEAYGGNGLRVSSALFLLMALGLLFVAK